MNVSYKLMSPNMRDHGKQTGIKSLQKNLAGANPAKKNFRPGKIDGVYGVGTAGAVKRAKWQLGFPAKVVNTDAGGTFIGIISGKVKLPNSFKVRARLRAKASAARSGLRDKAYAAGKAKTGVTERPAGSNRVEFSDWYGLVGPWCAMFVSWCYVKAGSKAFAKGQRYAYVPYVLSDAIGNKHGLSITVEPQHGDLVLFDWDKDGICDHIGIFDKWNDTKHSSLSVLEGNTAVGNDSNGGEVMHRTDRKRTNVRAFVRVAL